MGDVRFDLPYERLLRSLDRARLLYGMDDEEVVQALAAASKDHDPLLANVLATEAMNRMRRSRTAMANLGEAVVACDNDGRITSVNPAAERLIGDPRDVLLGQDLHDLIAFLDEDGNRIPRSASPLLRVRHTGALVEGEQRVATHQGSSHFYVSYVAAPVLVDNEIRGVVSAFRDVTEQHIDRERLRRSEQRYRALYRAVPFMTFTISEDLAVRNVNEMALLQLGYSPGELAAMPAVDLYVEEERAAMGELLQTVLTRGGIHRHESWKLRKDGTRFPVAETITRTQDPDGRPILVALCEDISRRKQDELMLAETRERLLSLFEGSPDGIVTLDLAGTILAVNEAATHFTGRGSLEVVGNSFAEYVDPADVERVWGLFQQVVQGEAQRTEFSILHKDGASVPARVTGIPILVGGEVVGVHGILQDLSAERRAQTMHTQLTQAALDAIVTIDASGTVVDWNPAAERLFGYARDEAIGRLMSELIIPPRYRVPHEAGLRSATAAGSSRGVAKRYELPALRKDGSQFDAEISITRLGSQEPLFTGFVRDISARRQYEATLERHVAERTRSLEEALRDLHTFTNGASHDLRAPLRGVETFLSALIEDHGDQLPEDARDLVNRALRESRRAGRLVQDLLSFARSAQGELNLQRLDATRLVKEIVAEIQADHPERSTRWNIQEDMVLVADPKLFGVALHGLLENASKYSSKAERPQVDISLTREDSYIVLTIRDNGVGFDPAEGRNLFQPFHRLSSAQGFEGTGLGLTTTHRIIARHDGNLELEGHPGKGTTARIRLPAWSIP